MFLPRERSRSLILLSLVFPIQVGHTGVYDAAVQAISATDKAVKTVYEACEAAGYVLLVTSDHGKSVFDP